MAMSSVAELRAIRTINARLQSLLERARSLKPTPTVDPALPTAELAADVDQLDEGLEEHVADPAYRNAAIETAARQKFFTLISSTSIEDPGFVEVWNLLDILLLCGDRGKCTPELVCWLTEELLDSQTTDGCRTVFDYLESRRERLAQKDFSKKNLVFLRSCNELLRRLSRAEDAIFCGRVFFFLFQTFPLGDKSSVNLRGEFHVENSTKFDVPAEDAGKDGEQMEVNEDGAKPPSETKSATPAPESTPQPPARPGSKAVPIKAPRKPVEEEALDNSTLYPIFWRLQQDFSEPTRLFAPDHFQSFKKGLAATILKFKKTPTVVQTKSAEDGQRGSKRKLNSSEEASDGKDDMADNYNPKYLTSRDLFDLELSDLAFQRHIFVQALILIDFLLSLTEKSKQKLTALGSSNKSLLYQYTLSEDDTKWAVTTRTAIKQSLQSTADGRFYDRMVETVLARDKNWVRWKVEACPSIVRDAVSTEQELEARNGAKGYTRQRKLPARPMGAMDLSFLTEGEGGGLESLKDASRFAAPSVEDLMKGVENDKLDLEMEMDSTSAEAETLRNMIDNKTWRTLRQARISRLGSLDKFEPGKILEEMLGSQEKEKAKDDEGGVEAEIEDAPASAAEAEAETEAAVQQVPEIAVAPSQDQEMQDEAKQAAE